MCLWEGGTLSLTPCGHSQPLLMLCCPHLLIKHSSNLWSEPALTTASSCLAKYKYNPKNEHLPSIIISATILMSTSSKPTVVCENMYICVLVNIKKLVNCEHFNIYLYPYHRPPCSKQLEAAGWKELVSRHQAGLWSLFLKRLWWEKKLIDLISEFQHKYQH